MKPCAFIKRFLLSNTYETVIVKNRQSLFWMSNLHVGSPSYSLCGRVWMCRGVCASLCECKHIWGCGFLCSMRKHFLWAE